MTDEPPPKKQLRLMVKSKEKVESLFQRRKRSRKQSTINVRDANTGADLPILSSSPYIAEGLAASTSSSNSSVTIENGKRHGKDAQHGNKLQNFMQHSAESQPTTRSTRVETVGTINDSNDLTPVLDMGDTLATTRASTARSQETSNKHSFTFESNNPCLRDPRRSQPTVLLARGPPFPNSTGAGPVQRPTQLHMEREFSDNVEHNISHLLDGTYRSDYLLTAGAQQSSESGGKKSKLPSILAESTCITEPSKSGPLDHLKLSAAHRPTPPKLDAPKEITRITDFIKPHLPIPATTAKLYRNNSSRPKLPPQIFKHTIPDRHEVELFLRDVEGDVASTRLPADGDLPFVTSYKTERVPVEARLCTMNHQIADPMGVDAEVRSDASNVIGLPYHAKGIIKYKVTTDGVDATQTSKTLKDWRGSAVEVADIPATVKFDLKRKRPHLPHAMPETNKLFKRSGNNDFNVFRDGFLQHPELCLLLSAQFPLKTLIDLYSISKDFHIIVNQRFTTVILNQAFLKAPHAARCYPWRCFKHLSQPDPAISAQTKSLGQHFPTRKVSHGNTDGATINILPAPAPPRDARFSRSPHLYPHTRRVPTFRWLGFAIHREKVIHAVYHAFAARGVPLPGDPADRFSDSFCASLHKLWFIFDIPDNPRRITYIQTPSLVSAIDLGNMVTFLVKLDMLCSNPIGAEKRDGMRKLLMSSCDGFDTILKVIRREEWRSELDVLRAWARYNFQLEHEEGQTSTMGGGWVPLGLTSEDYSKSKTIFGIPKEQVGMLKKEFWGRLEYDTVAKEKKKLPRGVRKNIQGFGRAPMYLVRPDQLITREIVKRGYKVGKQFLHILLSGYVDEDTGEAVAPRDLNSGRSRVLEHEHEYEVDDAIAGLRALTVEEGGDRLLDLGSTWQGNPCTVVHQGPSKQEMDRRRAEKERLSEYMAASKAEAAAEKRRMEDRGYRYVS